MKIWVVNPYGTLPAESWREYRSWMLAQAAERAGHQVVWWISNFEHRTKRHRELQAEVAHSLSPAVSVVLVPAEPYEKHVSLARIRSERSFARNFERLSQSFEPPSVIVLADPALFFGDAVLRVRNSLRCALVVDVLDLWPELFRLALPKSLRCLDRVLFLPLYLRRRQLLRDADGLVAVSADYAKVIAQESGCDSHVAYLGVDLRQFEEGSRAASLVAAEALAGWEKRADEVWVIYAGTLGVGYDMPTVVDAVRRLNGDRRVRFLVAGEGPFRPEIERLAHSDPERVRFLGLVTPEVLIEVYRYCDVGICSYAADSTVSMPVKLYDYLGAGLAVLSSLDAEAGRLLAERRVGLKYTAENPEALIQGIRALASDRLLLAEMRQRAGALAPTFDSSAQHDRLIEFVTEVVTGQEPGGAVNTGCVEARGGLS